MNDITDVRIWFTRPAAYDAWDLYIVGYHLPSRTSYLLTSDLGWIPKEEHADLGGPTLRVPGRAAKLVMEALKAGPKEVVTDVEWTNP